MFISSVLCDIKNDQGGRPLPLGWFTVSKVPKISELCCFDIESTKKKVKNRQINVCKWLKIVSKYYFDSFSENFEPIKNLLALKITKIQTFEIFVSSLVGRRPKFIEDFLSKVCRAAHFSRKN